MQSTMSDTERLLDASDIQRAIYRKFLKRKAAVEQAAGKVDTVMELDSASSHDVMEPADVVKKKQKRGIKKEKGKKTVINKMDQAVNTIPDTKFDPLNESESVLSDDITEAAHLITKKKKVKKKSLTHSSTGTPDTALTQSSDVLSKYPKPKKKENDLMVNDVSSKMFQHSVQKSAPSRAKNASMKLPKEKKKKITENVTNTDLKQVIRNVLKHVHTPEVQTRQVHGDCGRKRNATSKIDHKAYNATQDLTNEFKLIPQIAAKHDCHKPLVVVASSEGPEEMRRSKKKKKKKKKKEENKKKEEKKKEGEKKKNKKEKKREKKVLATVTPKGVTETVCVSEQSQPAVCSLNRERGKSSSVINRNLTSIEHQTYVSPIEKKRDEMKKLVKKKKRGVSETDVSKCSTETVCLSDDAEPEISFLSEGEKSSFAVATSPRCIKSQASFLKLKKGKRLIKKKEKRKVSETELSKSNIKTSFSSEGKKREVSETVLSKGITGKICPSFLSEGENSSFVVALSPRFIKNQTSSSEVLNQVEVKRSKEKKKRKVSESEMSQGTIDSIFSSEESQPAVCFQKREKKKSLSTSELSPTFIEYPSDSGGKGKDKVKPLKKRKMSETEVSKGIIDLNCSLEVSQSTPRFRGRNGSCLTNTSPTVEDQTQVSPVQKKIQINFCESEDIHSQSSVIEKSPILPSNGRQKLYSYKKGTDGLTKQLRKPCHTAKIFEHQDEDKQRSPSGTAENIFCQKKKKCADPSPKKCVDILDIDIIDAFNENLAGQKKERVAKEQGYAMEDGNSSAGIKQPDHYCVAEKSVGSKTPSLLSELSWKLKISSSGSENDEPQTEGMDKSKPTSCVINSKRVRLGNERSNHKKEEDSSQLFNIRSPTLSVHLASVFLKHKSSDPDFIRMDRDSNGTFSTPEYPCEQDAQNIDAVGEQNGSALDESMICDSNGPFSGMTGTEERGNDPVRSEKDEDETQFDEILADRTKTMLPDNIMNRKSDLCYYGSDKMKSEDEDVKIYDSSDSSDDIMSSEHHYCTQCNASFSIVTDLLEHKCRKMTKNSYAALPGHENIRAKDRSSVRAYRNSVAKHQCSICFKPFLQACHLYHHIRTVHQGIRLYKCEKCGKSFGEKQTLVVHVRTHTKERPYTCKKCSMKFVTVSNLNRHFTRAHGLLKKFLCEICCNQYVSQEALNFHLLEIHKVNA